MKYVLVPTDFSNTSLNALIYAFYLFKFEKVTFYLLNAFSFKSDLADVAIMEGSNGLFEDEADDSQEGLDEFLKKAKTHVGGSHFEFKTMAVAGQLEDVIQPLAKDIHFNFVVMGTQGATGAIETFLGSNTVRVIKRLKGVPIIVVPEEFSFATLNKMLYPTAYEYPFTEKTLSAVNYISDLWNCDVEVLYVEGENQPLNKEALTNKEQLSELLVSSNVDHITIEGYNSISKSIMAYAKKNNDKLIVLNYHEHGFFEKLLREPVVKKVAFHSEIPLLIVS